MSHDDFFQAVQKACLPGIWSRGVALARESSVLEDRRSEGELVLRVKAAGRPVAARVSLWPADEDWFCDCGDRADPCMHVAAAVAALRNGWTQETAAGATESSTKGNHVLYRFMRVEGSLALERWLVRADRQEPLVQSLVSLWGGISSGRISTAPVAATQADFAIDQALGSPSRAPLPRSVLEQVLKLLHDQPHLELDGKPVLAESRPVTLSAIVEDEGTGFRIRGERESSVTEVFQNGAALCGEVLRPFPDPGLSALERECVTRGGRFVSAGDSVRLQTELLPGLERKLRIEVRTRRLPRLCQEPPRIELRLEQPSPETLSVFPVLVYGEPVIAEIHQDRLHPLRTDTIPLRDLAQERELVRRLQSELQLQPGHRVTLQGEAAVRFVSECHDWSLRGPGTQAFEARGALQPAIRIEGEAGLRLFFGTAEGGTGEGPQADPERVLRAWSAGESFVPLTGGGWAALPRDWLERYGERIRLLLESRDARDPGKGVSPELRPALAEICEELGVPCSESLSRLRELLRDFNGLPEAPLPPDLKAELREYQKRGVNWLRFLSQAGMGALLADDMGLGKTLQALSALEGRSLVVCPTSVLQAWKEQLEQFRPGLPYRVFHGANRALPAPSPGDSVVLTTYGVLRVDQELLARERWETVILDEAQNIRNPESQLAQAAHRLTARFRIALSGTPVENRLDDLWSQFRFLNPGLLGRRGEFLERIAGPIGRGDARAAAELQKRIRPFLLRRLKRDVAKELPPRTETVLRCELSAAERELYESILGATRREILGSLESGGATLAALEALLRLRQACCHPALVPGSGVAGTSPSSKLELLLQSLESSLALGHRALVFSQWTSYLDLIEAELRRADIGFSRLDGSTRDREAVVNAFQAPDGPPVMLLSLKAGGVGITLTAADHVYIMDPWWNPAAEDQAADRAHRIGQVNPVLIHRLVAQDTIEDRVLALQKSKLQLAAAALEGATGATELTREDLLSLLG
ncbi:MAG: DEAD/DEAH box helicase [Oligoflexia bacterium]|nr:DEAD/DEAH box helicase [Oligoflexia bacterium]